MRRFSTLAYLAAALALQACATPQERCVAAAGQDLRVVNALIVETQETLERGYAFVDRNYTDEIYVPCARRKKREMPYYCRQTVLKTEKKPVAVDLRAEKAKLASLRMKRDQLKRRSTERIAACQARFPE